MGKCVDGKTVDRQTASHTFDFFFFFVEEGHLKH